MTWAERSGEFGAAGQCGLRASADGRPCGVHGGAILLGGNGPKSEKLCRPEGGAQLDVTGREPGGGGGASRWETQ